MTRQTRATRSLRDRTGSRANLYSILDICTSAASRSRVVHRYWASILPAGRPGVTRDAEYKRNRLSFTRERREPTTPEYTTT